MEMYRATCEDTSCLRPLWFKSHLVEAPELLFYECWACSTWACTYCMLSYCCGVSWQFFGRKVSFILSICIMCDRCSAGAEWVRHGKSMQGCNYWSMYRYAYGRYQGSFWWMPLASPPGTHGQN